MPTLGIDPVSGALDLVSRAGGAKAPGSGPAGTAPEGATPADFGRALREALTDVSRTQRRADALAEQFQLGNPAVSLEETMVAMQQANIAFQAVVQVRNRLVAAYSEIMNIQV